MGQIPIADAKHIAMQRRCPIVVVFGLNEDGSQFHVTSYGMTRKLCKFAKSFADQFAEAVFSGKVSPPATEPDDPKEVGDVETRT